MRILLQPAAGKIPLQHFKDTMDPGVLVESLRNVLLLEIYEKITELKELYVRVWGIVPTRENSPRNEWANLQEDDLVLFYGNKYFYFLAKVLAKLQSKDLALKFWGTDKEKRAWEYMYFLKEGRPIRIPYLPEVIGYKKEHIVRGAILLDLSKSSSLIQYIESKIGIIIDEDQIRITPAEEVAFNRKLKIPKTPEEAEEIINKLSESLSDEPVKERIKITKILTRNPTFARLVKQKAQYVCAVCGIKPFFQRSGSPYAEVHHIEELAITRIDHPSKMICVCPTCHRVIHYGDNDSLNYRKSLKLL